VGVIVETAVSPWGQTVPIHVAFGLIYFFFSLGLVFFIAHVVWLKYFAKPEQFEGHTSPAEAAKLPEKIKRHSFTARMFHLVQSLAMLTLLFTAFLPKVGVQFDWVEIHWIAGLVLAASILFHIVHASFFMDFWAIWPDKIDLQDAVRRLKRARGESAPPPRRFAKYPLENKMFHAGVMFAALTVAITGVLMFFRVRNPFFVRNPYMFGDFTVGTIYFLHGLAGVGFIFMVMVHIYFALRPEKFPMTKSMIFGTIDKEHYIEHHDPERWAAEAAD
jgi:cytochrome b subunit of formate dehydrogenase